MKNLTLRHSAAQFAYRAVSSDAASFAATYLLPEGGSSRHCWNSLLFSAVNKSDETIVNGLE